MTARLSSVAVLAFALAACDSPVAPTPPHFATVEAFTLATVNGRAVPVERLPVGEATVTVTGGQIEFRPDGWWSETVTRRMVWPSGMVAVVEDGRKGRYHRTAGGGLRFEGGELWSGWDATVTGGRLQYGSDGAVWVWTSATDGTA